MQTEKPAKYSVLIKTKAKGQGLGLALSFTAWTIILSLVSLRIFPLTEVY